MGAWRDGLCRAEPGAQNAEGRVCEVVQLQCERLNMNVNPVHQIGNGSE